VPFSSITHSSVRVPTPVSFLEAGGALTALVFELDAQAPTRRVETRTAAESRRLSMSPLNPRRAPAIPSPGAGAGVHCARIADRRGESIRIPAR
jgi:hypothetical protein